MLPWPTGRPADCVAILMLVAYGYPIAQFLIEPSPTAIVHRVQ